MNRPLRLALAGFVLLAGLLAALLLWPYQPREQPVVVLIEQGLGRRAIAARLAEKGVLWSRWPFLVYAFAQPHRSLKAGEYIFAEPLSPVEVFARLERGEVRMYPLTIPEGWSRWDIAGEVERMQLAPRDAFLTAAENAELIRDLAPKAKNLEGYLFPDTYHFARPVDPEAIVARLVGRFREVYAELEARPATAPARPLGERVTLASLVEKETGQAGERGLIAAVFYNRLERRLALQCDPTVIYAARLEAGGHFDGAINVSDLERNSPYNTYRHPGLPPGPIASPGRAALEAVLRPPKTNHLYFVSNTRGGHFFTASSSEHERNVVRYRRLRAEQERETQPVEQKRAPAAPPARRRPRGR